MLYFILGYIGYVLIGWWGVLIGITISFLVVLMFENKSKDVTIGLSIVGGALFIVGALIYINQQDTTVQNKNYAIPKDGYKWAEQNDIKSFEDCDDRYGSGTEAEDDCNKYVQETIYEETPTFGDYECTEDCGGHEAGYSWAEENEIEDVDDCGGNSDSFIEGCISYVEDTY